MEPRVDGSRALFQAVNFSPDGGATIARATDRLAPASTADPPRPLPPRPAVR